MTTHKAPTGSPFDPTLAAASERMRTLHLEAHGERLAAEAPRRGRTPLRDRVGRALIAIGSSLVTQTGSRRTSLAD